MRACPQPVLATALLGIVVPPVGIFAASGAVAVAHPGSKGAGAFYESLLPPEFGEKEKEEERFLRGWMASNEAAIHVVEEHDQTLRWWIRHLHGAVEATDDAQSVKRRLVVHVDTHLDVGTYPWGNWDELPKGEASVPSRKKDLANAREEVARNMIQSMHPGNYIGAGTVAGMISDVIWVRSNWPNSRYNGPPPGQFKVGFYLVGDGSTWAAAVCQEIFPDKGTQFFTSQVAADESRGIIHGSFDSCEQMVQYPNLKIQRPAIATFNLTVTTLDNFASDAAEVVRASGGELKEWLLDVDEDFFANNAPPWPFFKSLLDNFDNKEYRRVTQLLKGLSRECNFQEGHKNLFQLLSELPQQQSEWSAWSSGEASCKLTTTLKNEMTALVGSFSDAQKQQWSQAWITMFNDKFVLDKFRVFTPPQAGEVGAPENLPSKKELSKVINDFGRAMRTLVAPLGQPRVITLCRSMLNGFLPRNRWPAVEKGVHKALQQAFNAPKLFLVEDSDNPPEAQHRFPEWVSKPPQRGKVNEEL